MRRRTKNPRKKRNSPFLMRTSEALRSISLGKMVRLDRVKLLNTIAIYLEVPGDLAFALIERSMEMIRSKRVKSSWISKSLSR